MAKRYLLCTDLDRTLVPNGKQPCSPDALGRLKNLVSRDEMTLVFVTGRHKALIQQAISEYDLPRPDYAISDVGSTIYRIKSGQWSQMEIWDEHIASDWAGNSNTDLNHLLSTLQSLELQEPEKQNRHKLSYYVPMNVDTEALIGKMEVLLTQNNIKANLIWSIDEQANVGLLDVLPARANKLHAIEFLMKNQGYPLENTVFSGDSGNDLDVLKSGIHSVLVANAAEDVKKEAVAGSDPNTLYIAKGGYLGMNGNYSAGILEGLAHYLPEVDQWIRYTK